MAEIYLINDKVIFDTRLNILIDKENSTLKITLNRPISRCLVLLIERKGEIISQEDFFEFVWRAHGAKITANTYYQNISILRRTLAQMGLGDEIIKTVSRKGLMLSQSSEIVRVTSSRIPARLPVPEPNEPASSEHEVKKDSVEDARHPTLSSQRTSALKQHHLYYIFAAIVVMIFITTGLIKNFNTKSTDFFSHYKYVKSIKSCQVYSNHTFSGNEKLMLKERDIDCGSDKIIYLSYYYFSPEIHLLSCKNKKEEKEFYSCMSYYYIGGLIET